MTEYVFIPTPKSMQFGIAVVRRLSSKNYPEFFPELFIRVRDTWLKVVAHFSNN